MACSLRMNKMIANKLGHTSGEPHRWNRDRSIMMKFFPLLIDERVKNYLSDKLALCMRMNADSKQTILITYLSTLHARNSHHVQFKVLLLWMISELPHSAYLRIDFKPVNLEMNTKHTLVEFCCIRRCVGLTLIFAGHLGIHPSDRFVVCRVVGKVWSTSVTLPKV